jgi:hypothetical protein
LQLSGNAVGLLFNKRNLSPIHARRIGAPIVASLAIGASLLAADRVIDGAQYSLDSNIPTSVHNINPKLDRLARIPESGAFDFAISVDPNHDPRNGVADFQMQLGSSPEPGDLVAVPINK